MVMLDEKRQDRVVVPIGFVNRKKKSEDDRLHQIMVSNRRNQERIRRERIEANRSVLRNYRIKRNGKR